MLQQVVHIVTTVLQVTLHTRSAPVAGTCKGGSFDMRCTPVGALLPARTAATPHLLSGSCDWCSRWQKGFCYPFQVLWGSWICVQVRQPNFSFANSWNKQPHARMFPPGRQTCPATFHVLWQWMIILRGIAAREEQNETPNVSYSWRTAPLTSKVAFYIFIQQI